MTSDVRVVVEETDSDGGAPHRIARHPSSVLTTGVWLATAMALAALVLALAFQTHPVTDIAIGNTIQDGTLVRDFNAVEAQAASTGGRTYRWSQGESSLVFPGIGRTAATVTLTLAGGANPMPQVRLLANGGELTRLALTPDFADYTVSVPAPYLRTGNLTLTLDAPPFHAPGDRRELGVLVSRVRVVPAGGFALPPARPLLALWGAVVLLTLALCAAGLSGMEAAVAGVMLAAVLAVGIAENRFFVTVATAAWLRVSIITLLLALVLRGGVSLVARRVASGVTTHDARGILAVAVAIFAARLGGLWHPAVIVSDLAFHVHRFEDVVVRHRWYQEIPALYASGRPVPYPPAAYLLFAPFAAVPDHATLLTLGTQLLDAARVVLVGFIAWRVARRPVAGTCAALLAGAAPVAFLLFSWGNLTDATGEVALTVVFALLMLAWPRLREPRVAVAFAAALLFALLAHIGVAVTAVAFLGMAVVLGTASLLRRERSVRALRALVPLVALSLVAGALALALFYRVPLTNPAAAKAATVTDAPAPIPPLATTGYTIGAPRPDATIGLPAVRTANPVVAVIGQFGEEAWAFYRVWPLALAPVGVWLLRNRGRTPEGGISGMENMGLAAIGTEPAVVGTPYVALALSAWLLGALVLLVVGVLTGQFVRYAVSALPAVAVGAGTALASGWRWPWGRVAVIALLAFTALATLFMWYGRITRTYHV